MITLLPDTVEGVFKKFEARRTGLVKAFNEDVDKFYQQCNPTKDNLCLYGLPDETWKVDRPGQVVPPPLPEPTLGINFARDGGDRNEWLSLVCIHSDSWLLSVAFYLGAQSRFGKTERTDLFQKINDLPTVIESFEPAGPQMQACDDTLSSEKLKAIEDVFNDFKGRRDGLIKALTTDAEYFYEQSNPRKKSLCLYGLYNGSWELNLPVEELPPEIPEPALALNLARDAMLEKDWLSLVALHSDAWLLSVAFYFGARLGFDKNDREKLFEMINGLPTVLEVYAEAAAQAVPADEEEGKIELKKEKKKKKKKKNKKEVEEAGVESAKKKKREKDKAKDEAVSNEEKSEKKKNKKEVEEAGVESAKREKRKKDKTKDETEENSEKEKKKAARSPDVESAEEEKKNRKSDDVSLAPDAMMKAKLAVDEEEKKEKKKKKKKEVDEAARSPDVESAKKEKKKRKLDDVDVSPAPNALKKSKLADDEEEEKKEKKKKKVKEVDEAAPSPDGDSAKKDKATEENASSNEKSEKMKKKKEKDAEAVGSGDGGSKSKKKKKKNKDAGEE